MTCVRCERTRRVLKSEELAICKPVCYVATLPIRSLTIQSSAELSFTCQPTTGSSQLQLSWFNYEQPWTLPIHCIGNAFHSLWPLNVIIQNKTGHQSFSCSLNTKMQTWLVLRIARTNLKFAKIVESIVELYVVHETVAFNRLAWQ